MEMNTLFLYSVQYKKEHDLKPMDHVEQNKCL